MGSKLDATRASGAVPRKSRADPSKIIRLKQKKTRNFSLVSFWLSCQWIFQGSQVLPASISPIIMSSLPLILASDRQISFGSASGNSAAQTLRLQRTPTQS